MEKCPFRAGDVPEEAVVCVHCQRTLTEAPAGLPEAAVESVSAPPASADAPSRRIGIGLILGQFLMIPFLP